MSLIPSKRVDRIFPVVPPLCLLLAAQIAGVAGALRRHEAAAPRPYLGIVLVFATLFTGGYTVAKVIAGYRDHRDALAIFCRNVRQQAERHHWRYEVVSARDEGLLLYLDRSHFVQSQLAVAEWNSGKLDALVVPAESTPALMRDLGDAALSQIRSVHASPQKWYVLITR